MNTPDEVASATFDFLVIGAGAAGCVLANRLSERSDVTVCLLEAGPEDGNRYIKIPAGFIKIIGDRAHTWNFPTEPAPFTDNRQIVIPQGRTLGGGTSINGMAYNRGQRRDFDGWAAAGNPGWGYDDLLPLFKSQENWQRGASEYRGGAGPLRVTEVRWNDEVSRAFIAGALHSGVPANPDFNSAEQAGVGFSQVTIDRGRRVSSSTAFLKPVRGRRNLRVVTDATATKILFDGRKAVGATYTQHGATRTVRAGREVMVACGAINTPKLLQLSGVGDSRLLESIGVPLVHHLPGVGANLQDHYLVGIVARGKNYTSINQLAKGPRLWWQVAQWLLGRTSILGLPAVMVHYFLKSGLADGDADIQGVFTPASAITSKGGALDDSAGMTCATWQHRPLSVGYVRARSADARDPPAVQPNYLGHEYDRRVLLAACRSTRSLLGTPEMNQYFDGEVAPGAAVQTDDEWLSYARQTGSTVYHPIGTAKMGPAGDPMSVVDATLRVHGLDALRVVDSSIMPTLTSANTAAASLVIGEKGSRMILGKDSPA